MSPELPPAQGLASEGPGEAALLSGVSGTTKCCSGAGTSFRPGHQDFWGEKRKAYPTLAVEWGGELGHIHPQEGELRVGTCPGFSCLHYSANPGLRILAGRGEIAKTPEEVSSL